MTGRGRASELSGQSELPSGFAFVDPRGGVAQIVLSRLGTGRRGDAANPEPDALNISF
jgi:hypothetical protein